MSALVNNAAQIAGLLVWVGLWTVGGWWLTLSAFNLRRNELALVGFTVGLVVETLLANGLARLLPLPLAFWAAAGLTFVLGLGLAASRDVRRLLRIPIVPAQWLALVFLTYVFTSIGRGLALYDDYAHLPTLSLMATGDIPPHFSLDPSVPYGYHYFLMLFATQIMRIADLLPWTALDFSRGLSFALAILLAGVWVRRLTHNAFAGFLGGVLAAFGMGTRWLLLLLPAGVVASLGQNVQMIGSGLSSGPDLATALISGWGIDGSGPIPFPFAFVNGIYGPGVLGFLGANGLIDTAVSFSILLTFNRWRNWRGPAVTVLLVAASGLLGETGLVLSLVSWSVLTVIYVWRNRRLRLPSSLRQWWLVLLAGNLLGVFQGGAWTDLIRGWIEGAQASYQTIGFALHWTPAIVSAHLGVLSLLDPHQLLIALLEIGPILLVLPLVCVWGVKAFRAGRWYEAAFVITGVITLGMVLVQFTGSTGVRNTSRLYGFVGLCSLFAVPVTWRWVEHRSAALKTLASAIGLTIITGGVVLFGVELAAIQKPILSNFISDLDARMYKNYWNQLEPGALVFDSDPYRAPTVFGRPTNSSTTWFETKPEWKVLAAAPDPVDLRAAGFRYVYLDNRYWDQLPQRYQERLSDPCVQVVQVYEDWKHDSRTLLDIGGCGAAE